MNKIIGIILLLIGGFLIYQGVERKDSLLGGAAEVGTSVANKVDGSGRIPKHYYYIIGGAVIAAVGVGMAFRGGKK